MNDKNVKCVSCDRHFKDERAMKIHHKMVHVRTLVSRTVRSIYIDDLVWDQLTNEAAELGVSRGMLIELTLNESAYKKETKQLTILETFERAGLLVTPS